jgi:hypothetical protein
MQGAGLKDRVPKGRAKSKANGERKKEEVKRKRGGMMRRATD